MASGAGAKKLDFRFAAADDEDDEDAVEIVGLVRAEEEAFAEYYLDEYAIVTKEQVRETVCS